MTDASTASTSIAENLERLHHTIAEACARVDRDPASVALMAVSKVHPVEALLEAYAAGQRLFGENRVQEAQEKSPSLAGLADLQLHLIGPLQNNKIAKAAEVFHAVDTLDSLKTASRLDAACAALGRRMPVLVEVKLSTEETKHGLASEQLSDFLSETSALANLDIRGLMTVPPFSDNAETARPYFQQLRRLRDENAGRFPSLTELSMGMSGDFVVAIEEGSTCVRVGTAIFGKRSHDLT